jgi:hypothetical protein
LSTDVALSPIEKILLARAHKVASWLDEGVTSLTADESGSTLKDLAALGWETAAQILWIRDSNPSQTILNTLSFRRNAIKCPFCVSPSSLINGNHTCDSCGCVVPADAGLTHPDPGATSGTDRVVTLRSIRCKCGGNPFSSSKFRCSSCQRNVVSNNVVRIGSYKKALSKEMFGEEIEDYKRFMTVA